MQLLACLVIYFLAFKSSLSFKSTLLSTRYYSQAKSFIKPDLPQAKSPLTSSLLSYQVTVSISMHIHLSWLSTTFALAPSVISGLALPPTLTERSRRHHKPKPSDPADPQPHYGAFQYENPALRDGYVCNGGLGPLSSSWMSDWDPMHCFNLGHATAGITLEWPKDDPNFQAVLYNGRDCKADKATPFLYTAEKHGSDIWVPLSNNTMKHVARNCIKMIWDDGYKASLWMAPSGVIALGGWPKTLAGHGGVEAGPDGVMERIWEIRKDIE